MAKAKSAHPGFKRIQKSLDSIARADLAYELEQALKSGMTATQLRHLYQAKLTARQILIGLTSEDDGRATNAIKDLMDRSEGKPMEKQDVTHHLAKLTDEQLEAMIRTEMSDLEIEKSEKLLQ